MSQRRLWSRAILFLAALALVDARHLNAIAAEGDDPKPAVQPGVVDDLLHDFELNGAPAPRELFPEVPWLNRASPRDRTRYLNSIKHLLKFQADGRKSLREEAGKTFADARLLCDDDPRLPLAYGLYLLKIDETAAAQEVFERSAQHAGQRCLPILQAAAMCRLTSKNYDRAWSWLEKTAAAVSQSETMKYPSLAQRRQGADWLGATGTWLASIPKDTLGAPIGNLADLRALLSVELQPLFDAGHARTEHQLAELQQFSQEAAGDAAQKLKAAQAKITSKLNADRTAAEELEKTIRQQSRELADAQKEERSLRSELNRLNQQREQHQEAVDDLSQPRIYSEVKMKSRTIRRMRVQTPVEVQRAETTAERTARLEKLQDAKSALTTAQARLETVKNQLNDAKEARLRTAVHVRQQTEQERTKLAELKQSIESLDRLRDRLNRLASEPDQLAEHLKSPEILLDWNPDDLADRLRATFEPPKSTAAGKHADG